MTHNIKSLIAAMLTENTGTHMLDSGGDNGRAWQQNIGKAVADFQAEPSATAEIYVREWEGKLTAEVLPTVSVFHLLTGGVLELDDLCHAFNAMPVDNWGSDEFYGVSVEGAAFINAHGFLSERHNFNTYNWSSNHSQVLQGAELTLGEEFGDDRYILLQIHGGADVRGGYTDAKLFKLADHAEFYNVVEDNCGFSDPNGDNGLSWHGEWINSDGGCADDDDLLAFALAAGASLETPTVTIAGDGYFDY